MVCCKNKFTSTFEKVLFLSSWIIFALALIGGLVYYVERAQTAAENPVFTRNIVPLSDFPPIDLLIVEQTMCITLDMICGEGAIPDGEADSDSIGHFGTHADFALTQGAHMPLDNEVGYYEKIHQKNWFVRPDPKTIRHVESLAYLGQIHGSMVFMKIRVSLVPFPLHFSSRGTFVDRVPHGNERAYTPQCMNYTRDCGGFAYSSSCQYDSDHCDDTLNKLKGTWEGCYRYFETPADLLSLNMDQNWSTCYANSSVAFESAQCGAYGIGETCAGFREECRKIAFPLCEHGDTDLHFQRDPSWPRDFYIPSTPSESSLLLSSVHNFSELWAHQANVSKEKDPSDVIDTESFATGLEHRFYQGAWVHNSSGQGTPVSQEITFSSKACKGVGCSDEGAHKLSAKVTQRRTFEASKRIGKQLGVDTAAKISLSANLDEEVTTGIYVFTWYEIPSAVLAILTAGTGCLDKLFPTVVTVGYVGYYFKFGSWIKEWERQREARHVPFDV